MYRTISNQSPIFRRPLAQAGSCCPRTHVALLATPSMPHYQPTLPTRVPLRTSKVLFSTGNPLEDPDQVKKQKSTMMSRFLAQLKHDIEKAGETGEMGHALFLVTACLGALISVLVCAVHAVINRPAEDIAIPFVQIPIVVNGDSRITESEGHSTVSSLEIVFDAPLPATA